MFLSICANTLCRRPSKTNHHFMDTYPLIYHHELQSHLSSSGTQHAGRVELKTHRSWQAYCLHSNTNKIVVVDELRKRTKKWIPESGERRVWRSHTPPDKSTHQTGLDWNLHCWKHKRQEAHICLPPLLRGLRSLHQQLNTGTTVHGKRCYISVSILAHTPSEWRPILHQNEAEKSAIVITQAPSPDYIVPTAYPSIRPRPINDCPQDPEAKAQKSRTRRRRGLGILRR